MVYLTWFTKEEIKRACSPVEPESMNVGQLNTSVKILREVIYQNALKAQQDREIVTALYKKVSEVSCECGTCALCNALMELGDFLKVP